MMDIFQFSNTYTINGKIKQLLHSESMQYECIHFVSRFGMSYIPCRVSN